MGLAECKVCFQDFPCTRVSTSIALPIDRSPFVINVVFTVMVVDRYYKNYDFLSTYEKQHKKILSFPYIISLREAVINERISINILHKTSDKSGGI